MEDAATAKKERAARTRRTARGMNAANGTGKGTGGGMVGGMVACLGRMPQRITIAHAAAAAAFSNVIVGGGGSAGTGHRSDHSSTLRTMALRADAERRRGRCVRAPSRDDLAAATSGPGGHVHLSAR